MFAQQDEWVILGLTLDGEAFAVPDWADRLCGMLAQQSHDQRLSYSDYLRPVVIDGLKAVVLRTSLEQVDPQAFALIQSFATENRLKTRSGRAKRSGGSTGSHPVLRTERRDA